MAETETPKAPPSGRAPAPGPRSYGSMRELYELDHDIKAAKSNPKRFQLLRQAVNEYHAFLAGVGVKLKDPQERAVFEKTIWPAAERLMRRIRRYQVPIPPYPFPEVKPHGNIITYEISVDGDNGHDIIGQTAQSEMPLFVRDWYREQKERYFYDGVNQLWHGYTRYRKWFAMLGVWTIDDVTPIEQAKSTSRDLMKRLRDRELAESRVTGAVRRSEYLDEDGEDDGEDDGE